MHSLEMTDQQRKIVKDSIAHVTRKSHDLWFCAQYLGDSAMLTACTNALNIYLGEACLVFRFVTRLKR